MNEQTTITGLVATTPRHELVPSFDGVEETVLTFRLAAHNGDRCNWYTIKCQGRLADNVHLSVDKGDRIIVTGKIEVHEWDNGEQSGTSAEIVASAIGYDLNYGTSVNTRVSITADN